VVSIVTGSSHRIDYPLLAIAFYLGNLMIMVIVTALVKAMTEYYPVSQVLLFRYLFVVIPMLLIVFVGGGRISVRTVRYKDHAIRTISGITSLGLFFYAISLSGVLLSDFYRHFFFTYFI